MARQFCQSEVHDLHLAVVSNHDISRFDIPVDNVSVMGVMKSHRHLDADVQCFLQLQRACLYLIL